MVVAYRKVAHDSNVLHTMLLSDRWDIWHFLLLTSPRCDRKSGLWIIYFSCLVFSVCPYEPSVAKHNIVDDLFDLWPLQTTWSLLTTHLSSAAHLDQLWLFNQRQIHSLLLQYVLVSHSSVNPGTCNKRELHLSSTRGRRRSSSSSSLETKNKSPDHISLFERLLFTVKIKSKVNLIFIFIQFIRFEFWYINNGNINRCRAEDEFNPIIFVFKSKRNNKHIKPCVSCTEWSENNPASS